MNLFDLMNHFDTDGAALSITPYGSGHINRSYLVVTDRETRYILQKISDAFEINGLMQNILAVTSYIRSHSDDPRATMNLVLTRDGHPYYTADDGNYRVFEFVEGTIVLQNVERPEDFYESAVGFGQFQNLLSDFPADTLTEPIRNFHNTVDRCRIFHQVLDRDPMGRAAEVAPEIRFVLDHEAAAGTLQHMRESGELPLRVTHNDTKLNNVLLDAETRKAVCVIDLDTVMPGLSLYDFGDAIRFGTATAAEDEKDLSLVTIDLSLFETFARGYLDSCPSLTEREIDMLPMGALVITLECGIRFLTDYLDGDHYFATQREKQNLDRARTQFKMVTEMEKNLSQMEAIIQKLRTRS